MAQLPFDTNNLLDPQMVVQYQSTVEAVRDQCLELVNEIIDRRGDICERLSPSHQDELRASISSITALQKKVEGLRQDRRSLQTTVDSINDDLAASANQGPEDCMEKCCSLRPETLAILLRINQLAFKGTEIPGLSPEQKERLRAEARLLEPQQSQRDSAAVTCLQRELEAERGVSESLRVDIRDIRQANDNQTGKLSRYEKHIERLERDLQQAKLEVEQAALRQKENLERIDFLDKMTQELATRANVEQEERASIIAENSKLETMLKEADERNKELTEKLYTFTMSKDETNGKMALIQWTLKQEKASKTRLEVKLAADEEDWRARLDWANQQKDEFEDRYQVHIKQLSEKLSDARETVGVWKERATVAEKESREAKDAALRMETRFRQTQIRMSELSEDLKSTKVAFKSAERRLASSETEVQDLKRDLKNAQDQLEAHEDQSIDTETAGNTPYNSLQSYSTLRQSLVQNQEQNMELTKALREVQEERDVDRLEFEQEATKLRQDIIELQGSLDESRKGHARLEEQLSSLQGASKFLEARASAREEELNGTQTDLQSMTEQLREVESNLEQQVKEKEDLVKANSELLASLQSANLEASSALQKLEQNQSEFEEQLGLAKRSLEAERQSHEHTREEARKDRASIQQVLSSNGKDFHERTIELTNNFTTRLEERIQELHEVKVNLASQQQHYAVLQQTHQIELGLHDHSRERYEYYRAKADRSEAEMSKYISGLQTLFTRICTDTPLINISGLVQKLQGQYCRSESGSPSPLKWPILRSWNAEGDKAPCLGSYDNLSLELLIFQLLELCGRGMVATPLCLDLILVLIRVLGSCVELQPDLLVLLAGTIERSILLCPEEAFEAGFAFWQMMSIVDKRWMVQFGSSHPRHFAWESTKGHLEMMFQKTSYRKLFMCLKLDIEPQHMAFLPKQRWGKYLVMCEPSWPKALVIDTECRSIRFFHKSRLAVDTGGGGFRISPVPGEDPIILSPWSMEGTMWVIDSFWGDS